MSITNKFNAGTNANVQSLVNDITTLMTNVPNFQGVDFSWSPGFVIEIRVGTDGRFVTFKTHSADQGPSNAYGPADSSGHYTRSDALVIDGATQL